MMSLDSWNGLYEVLQSPFYTFPQMHQDWVLLGITSQPEQLNQ